MANTGKQVVLTLKEIYSYNNQPTGNTKPNVVGDPDYISPITDLTACPITYTTACPSVVATAQTNKVEYEFAVLNSVINNPTIKKIQVRLRQGVTTIDSHTYILPHSNYFTGVLTAPSGTYSIEIVYLDISNAVLATCSGLATVTVL